MSQLSTPSQAKPVQQKSINSFFGSRKTDLFTTPSSSSLQASVVTDDGKSETVKSIEHFQTDQQMGHCNGLTSTPNVVNLINEAGAPIFSEVTPATPNVQNDVIIDSNFAPEIDRLVASPSGCAAVDVETIDVVSIAMADPSKTLFDDSDSPVVIDLETALETASVPVIDPRKSTMPPLPPRKIEPKKRKVEKKAVVSVEGATDSEAEANGVASDATAATPAKSAVKRVRKPAAKKTVATTEGSVETSTDAAEGDDVSEPMDVSEGGEGVESVVESTKKTSSGSTKKPRPPAKRGLAALKALESYNNSGGKEAMQEKRVVATVNYSDDSGILAAVDSLIKKDKASSSSSACSGAEGDAVEKAAEVVIKEYSPEIVAKIASNREKIHALVSELLQWEGASDMADQNLDLSLAVDDLVRFVTNTAVATPAVPVATTAVADSAAVENSASTEAPVAAESTGESEAATSPATPSAAAPAVAVVSEEEDVADTLFKLIRVINARCIQGSHLTKTELSQLVSLTLAAAVEKINIACEEISHIDGANALSAYLNEISDAAVRVVVDRQQRVLSAIQQLNTPAALLIEISVVATRKHFGNPANKPHASLEGEDVNDAAVWRWVVNYNHLFTKAGQAVLREVGAVRARYSKTIKSFAKVVDDLMNESCSASALAVSEERAAKNMVEVEKAKEKRRELEVKRAADALERANKEAIKEQKRREKEENDLKKKLAAEAKAEAAAAAKEAAALAKANAPHVEKEKKVHVPTEKELKEALLLEKQKNAMKGFFFASKPAAASSTSSSSANSAVKPQQQSSHSSSSSSSSSSTAAAVVASDSCAIDLTGSSNSVPMVVDLEVAKSPRLVAFEAAMSANMSMSEVLTAHRVRAQETRKAGKKGSRKPRKPLKLFVNVNLPNPAGAFGDDANNYTELRERTVDSRMRTLLFSEDHRPAYVGTFSKKSLIVSGRRPTARDEEMLSYDYDSEAEWDEEVEGEDIGDSGDEDEEDGGAANELMYDDFFRRDNDYGSDAESDVEGGLNTAAAISIREREEVVGPRFVTSSHVVTYPLTAGAATPKNVVKAYRAEINRNDCNSSSNSSSSSSSGSPTGVSFIVCGDRDADVQRLSQYAAVAFTPTHLMPYLGDARNQPQVTSSSSEGAKKEAGSATKSKKKKIAAVSAGTDSSEAGAVNASTPTAATAAATEGEVAEGEGKTVFIKGFDETKLSALITAVHGKKEGIDKLVAAFQAEQPHMSKVQIKKRIMEVADKSKHAEGHGTLRWVVKPEFFEKAGVESPEPLEFTPLKKKKRIEPTKVSGPASASAAVSSSSGGSSIAPTSVSSFISAFMPAAVLDAVAQSPATTDAEPSVAPAGVQQAQSAAVPSTPVKSAQKSITAFVTLTSPSKNMPTSSGGSNTSNSGSSSSGSLFGNTVKSTPVKRALSSVNSSSSNSASKSTVDSSNKKARKSPSPAAPVKATATTPAVPVVVDLLEDEAV